MHPLVAEAIATISHAKLDDIAAGEFQANSATRHEEVEQFIKKFIKQHPELAEEFTLEFALHGTRMYLAGLKALKASNA